MTVVNDTYTGHVDAGTAARRTLPAATIVKASVGPMDNNAYLITCSATGKTLLIDAANDGPALVELIRSQAPDVELIVTSHQHFDHWQALAEVVLAVVEDDDVGVIGVDDDALMRTPRSTVASGA
ncbi:MBL fold metallo-hydrolase, partial [Mycolicibacterium phocaicum]